MTKEKNAIIKLFSKGLVIPGIFLTYSYWLIGDWNLVCFFFNQTYISLSINVYMLKYLQD